MLIQTHPRAGAEKVSVRVGDVSVEAIEVQDLIAKIDAAATKMGAANPNRKLLAQCKIAITYLASIAPDELLATPERKPLIVLP